MRDAERMPTIDLDLDTFISPVKKKKTRHLLDLREFEEEFDVPYIPSISRWCFPPSTPESEFKSSQTSPRRLT